ncbi:MAG: hypothetical protein FJ265_11130 [Planctomycetes bacterium]|nr:hypothetical protein [Planctomycetota bacterium]
MRPRSSLAAVPFAFLLALSLAPAAAAQALLVPSQYPTIAAALAAAPANATVLVAPGTYAERLTWPAVDGIRLVGEQGAAATTIDGGAGGTVVAFGSGLTRATVLAGFTISNGFLGSSGRGAGISISGGSPTIRDCRITGNAIDGTTWNYGGGVYVSGGAANPLLQRNEIDGNELRNGSWNYGAGVHVASGARADLIGNHVHDNRNLSPAAVSGGRGHGGGVYVAGTALLASNLIAGNTNATTSWNYGGGVAVPSGGTATLHNNTIAGNVLTGGNWRYGGGVYVDGTANVTMRGNIVAANAGAGIYRSSTGTGIVDSDWDDVWNNSPDYSGVTPGGNSITLDPKFASATDYHLLPSSPCIDEVPNAHLLPVAAVDLDGNPRQIDGDLDGSGGDGARLDFGADEFAEARLAVIGSPQIGTTVVWSLAMPQPSLTWFAVALDTGNLLVEPYGNLLLGQSAFLVGLGATPAGFPFAIPNDPTLRAVLIHGQGLVLPLGGTAGQFTNLASLTTF